VQNLVYPSLPAKDVKIKLCRPIIVQCEERSLRVLENRVLRRIFERKRDEMTEEWRKLHNEELNELYSTKEDKNKPIKCTN